MHGVDHVDDRRGRLVHVYLLSVKLSTTIVKCRGEIIRKAKTNIDYAARPKVKIPNVLCELDSRNF